MYMSLWVCWHPVHAKFLTGLCASEQKKEREREAAECLKNWDETGIGITNGEKQGGGALETPETAEMEGKGWGGEWII